MRVGSPRRENWSNWRTIPSARSVATCALWSHRDWPSPRCISTSMPPAITVSRLLKSCATPETSVPSASPLLRLEQALAEPRLMGHVLQFVQHPGGASTLLVRRRGAFHPRSDRRRGRACAPGGGRAPRCRRGGRRAVASPARGSSACSSDQRSRSRISAIEWPSILHSAWLNSTVRPRSSTTISPAVRRLQHATEALLALAHGAVCRRALHRGGEHVGDGLEEVRLALRERARGRRRTRRAGRRARRRP